MVFLLSKQHEAVLPQHLSKYQYLLTGNGQYVRQKYPDKQFPIYRLIVGTDSMNHNLLLTLTMETLPEKREVKENYIVFHKGTVVQEELARITKTLP